MGRLRWGGGQVFTSSGDLSFRHPSRIQTPLEKSCFYRLQLGPFEAARLWRGAVCDKEATVGYLRRLCVDTLSHVFLPPSPLWSPSNRVEASSERVAALLGSQRTAFAGGCKQRAKCFLFLVGEGSSFRGRLPLACRKNTTPLQCANLWKSPRVYRLLPVHTSIQSAVMPESNYFNLSPSLSLSFPASQYFCGSWSRSAPPDGASSAWQGAM